MKRIVFVLLSAILINSCSIFGFDSTRCKLPNDFTEDDLIGMWVKEKLDLARDTLIIREDGFFKQIIHLSLPVFDYESEWLTWEIEYSEPVIPYLYLTGYRLYAFDPDLISSELVGGGDGYWWDFCRSDRLHVPPGEGVLIVSGVPWHYKQPPRGIEISFPGRSNENSPWTYTLEEP